MFGFKRKQKKSLEDQKIQANINTLNQILFKLQTNVVDLLAFKDKSKELSDNLAFVKQIHDQMPDIAKKIASFEEDFDTINGISDWLRMEAQACKEWMQDCCDEELAKVKDFSDSHQFSRRLASLETRITKLEIPHGSGKSTSKSAGTDKNKRPKKS